MDTVEQTDERVSFGHDGEFEPDKATDGSESELDQIADQLRDDAGHIQNEKLRDHMMKLNDRLAQDLSNATATMRELVEEYTRIKQRLDEIVQREEQSGRAFHDERSRNLRIEGGA